MKDMIRLSTRKLLVPLESEWECGGILVVIVMVVVVVMVVAEAICEGLGVTGGWEETEKTEAGFRKIFSQE